MRNTLVAFLITLILFTSCKEAKKEEIKENIQITDTIPESTVGKSEKIDCDGIDTLEYQDSKIIVYNELKIRGNGVLTITINDKVTILNEDDTVFGEIILKEESDYEIKLPSKIIARSFIPVFDIFSFDAEEPNANDEFLKVYINKELKKINKNQVGFDFKKWEDYVKSSFVKVRNCNIPGDSNVYQVLKIDENVMKIKSISKETCDMVESYIDVTKEINWKSNDGVLLIHFYSCN